MKTYMLMVLAALCVFLALRPEVQAGWEARNKVAGLEWKIARREERIEALLNLPTPAPVVVTRVVVQDREVQRVVWVWLVVAAGAVAGLVLGFALVAGAIVAHPRGALHPGEPGFDEAMHRAAGAVGGATVECEGAYWLCVPGREPVRVVRLLEDRGE